MTDLTAAMQAAVESVDVEPRPRTTSRPRPRGAWAGAEGGVALRQADHGLPPISSVRRSSTFGNVLRETFGPTVAVAWTTLREGFLLIVAFWVAAILIGFVLAEQTTLPVVLMAAVALRLALLAATWTGQAVEAASR